MSLLNADDDQRWVPTHVQVTVLRARGLRAKGKHGTSDVYTIIQVGKEKFTTCVVEKTTAPEWKEECSFELPPGVLDAEGRSAYPAGSSELLLTVMHRALIGLDVFLGQALIPLDQVFQDRISTKNEWYKLNSKSGKKEKERGEVQVTVQFTRNNLTASMYDLSARDKPTSAFGRLKDRMKGKRAREDGAESASAVVPGGFAGASRPRRTRLPSDGGGEEDYEDDEGGEGRRSRMRNFFLRGKLRKSSDTRSSTSLGSESSESSSRGGSLSPSAGISVVVSDLSNSPSETSNLTADNSPEHTSLPSPNLPTHKRAFSDEVALISAAPPPPKTPTSQSLKSPSGGGGGGALSRSSLCVNGSHVYAGDPPAPANTATLGLLHKCSPLSRSLQNLARRSDDPPGAEGRRWSFDKAAREETASATVTAATAPAATAEGAAADGKKQKKNLFSQGRSNSAGKGAEQSQAPPPTEEKEKHKGWFGSKDSTNKPSLEVSPKVESSSDAVPSHPLTPSLNNHSCTGPASATRLASPGVVHNANPFTSPPDTPTISPSNPFFTRLQCNPFFVDLLGDHPLKSAPPAPCLSSSPVWPPTFSSSWSDPSSAQDYPAREPGVGSQFGELGTRARASSNPFFTSPTSENPSELEESFEAFARARVPPSHTTNLSLEPAIGQTSEGLKFDRIGAGDLSPIPLQRPTKIPIFKGHQSQRFDWTEEPGINRDLFPPPQIDVSPWGPSKEEPGDHAPVEFQEANTGADLFSDWNPEKPLDYSLSSPQFVNVSTLIPKSTSAGQPITSPFGKDLGETSGTDVGRDGAGTPAQQEDSTPASAIVSHVPEGVPGENYFSWEAPSVFGEEPMHKTDSSPDKVASEAKISTFEPDASLSGANPFFTTIPSPKFPETQLEGLENTTADPFIPIHEAITEQMSTNSVDLPQITTPAVDDSLNEACAPIFDLANSVLPNTDTASSLSDAIANNTEINNNSTNDLANSPSPFVHDVIMNELNARKTDSLFSELPESSLPADVVGLPTKADTSLSVSNEGLPLESVSDSKKAVEFLADRSLSIAVVEAPDTSPAEVGEKDNLLLGKVGLELEETCAEHALEKEQSHTPTKLQEPVSQNLDMVPLADTASDSTLEEGTITLDNPGSYSDLMTLGADPKEALQESCDEKNGSLNVKDSSGTSEINESTLSEYLEARESGPPMSPFPDALAFITAIEDPDPVNGWESLDVLSTATGSESLPLKSEAGEKSASPEEGGFAPFSLGAADPSTAAQESVEPEKPHGGSDSSQPPPKPPRLFQDSLPFEECMIENPQPGLGDEAESKHPGAPKDSPTDIFQTPKVSSGPDFLQASRSPLPSESSLLSAAADFGREKTDAKCRNSTFSVMKDELTSKQEDVQLSGFSAFDLEENSDQSWLTSKIDFKFKELDTSNFAVWSADEENAIRTDSTFLNKAILMEDSTEGESAHVLDVGTQPNMFTDHCSPTQKLKEGLKGSFLDQLKGTKPQMWTESVEPTWQSLPSLGELSSTVSQDLVKDLSPEDLHKPQIEEGKQPALMESLSDPVLLPQPSSSFFGPDLISLPMDVVGSATDLKAEPPAEVPSTLKSLPSIGVNPTSSLFLHDCNPQGSSTPSLLAETNAQLAFLPSPILALPPERPTTDTTQASSIASPSKPPALIDTPFMLLPQEAQLADGPPSTQPSSPHPVKPLNATAPQEEKKGEGRSVLASGLEKLKSTIHPGRAAQPGEPEADKSKPLSEGVDRYFHLSHSELVALLLQREVELERRGAEFERQGALLEKREAELKKMKVQTRDLEDYIDRLLVRIMEQTPTLLQVRSKLK